MIKKRGKNKAQVTAFIIIAILIVVVIAIFLSITFKSSIEEERINPVVLPIYNYIGACAKQTGQDAIHYIGQTGGYFISPNLSIGNTAVYFNKGENNLPTKEKIEDELALYMNNMLFFCTKGFRNFPDFNISQGEIKTKAKIDNNKVVFNIVYPLTISKGEKTYSLEKVNAEVPVRLNTIYSVLEKIMQEQMKNKNDICLSCLNNLAFDNNLYIDMADYTDNSVLFLITDENSKINDDYYIYYFVNKYV